MNALRLLAIAAAVTWLAAAPAAQFKSSVATVAVWATVNDGRGRLATQLEREDFRILDNGTEREITFFSNDPQHITVALMLDMSGSMMPRFLKVRESTERFIKALIPGDRAQIGSFGDEIAISPLLTGDKEILMRVLREELWPSGATPLWNAVDAAMTALRAESGRRVVLMLTDGADSCDFPDCLDFGDAKRRATREDFMVYAIAMDDRGIGGELTELTELTGGGHFELGRDDNLTATFEQVTEELRHQYMLGFVPATDGKEHKLEVQVRRDGMRARARKSYVAARR
jgi:Ca-activated chloride channel family protein